MNTSLNWVGSKAQHITKISTVLSWVKEVDYIVDPMSGSGNLVLGLQNIKAKVLVAGDLVPLGPRYLMALSEIRPDYEFLVIDALSMLSNFSMITDKADYYHYRDWWNEEVYHGETWDPHLYVLSTVLLLKMCSNSMVRLNSHDQFNQGFRGIHTNEHQFFSGKKIENIIAKLNELIHQYSRVRSMVSCFPGYDFEETLQLSLVEGSSAIVLLDPPYIPDQRVYSEYTREDQARVIDAFLRLSTRPKTVTVLFSYLGLNPEIDALSKRFRVHSVNVTGHSGQQRKLGSKEVDEVMIVARNGL